MKLPAALIPLRGAAFRGLWFAWLAANLTMWMSDVAAAWLMTTLTDSTLMVALVQSASTLPLFLLGLPSGALADIVDRRRLFALAQAWVALVAVLVAALAFRGALSPVWLLILAALNGIGSAMRWPVFAAIVPQVVDRPNLPAALALNGVSMNVSRVVGPSIAGVLLASLGPAWVFVFNAMVSVVALVLVLRWPSANRQQTLPPEPLFGAIRVGLQHVHASPPVRAAMLRVFLFALQMSALVALMPLLARGLGGTGPGVFSLLLATLGAGAITSAMLLPRWRRRLPPGPLVVRGCVVHALAIGMVALAPDLWFAVAATFVVGMAWIAASSTLSMVAQLSLPDWVRARGMSMYQMALMAGTGFGAMLFGTVAGWVGVNVAILIAAGAGLMVLPALRRWPIEPDHRDLQPAAPPGHLPNGPWAGQDGEGPVMVTITYRIDPDHAAAFVDEMLQTRAARMRLGVTSWSLLRDATSPGCYVERFVDRSWLERRRRIEQRYTAADADLRRRRLAFHIGDAPPVVQCFVRATA